MIKKYNNLSLAIGIPGVVLQFLGAVTIEIPGDGAAANESVAPALVQLVPVLAILLGTALLIVGLGFYARAKGRSPLWCLMGFLGVIGLLVLGLLGDRTTPHAHAATTDHFTESHHVGGGILHRLSLILGIFSLIACFVPGVNLLMAIPAIICGHKALARSREDPTIGSINAARAGMICGYIGAALGTAALVIIAANMMAPT